jgi:hypothetical protein
VDAHGELDVHGNRASHDHRDHEHHDEPFDQEDDYDDEPVRRRGTTRTWGRSSSRSIASRVKPWHLVALLLVVAVVGAGIYVATRGSSAKGVSLNSAAKKTEGVDSLQFEIDSNLAPTDGTPIKGVLDAKDSLLQLNLDGSEFAGLPQGSLITALYDSKNLVMYLGGDYVQTQLATGKQFIELNIDSLGGAAGFGSGQLGWALQSNPLSVVQLASKATKVTDIGPETVLSNVPAQHFQFKVNTTDFLKAVKLDTNAKVVASRSSLPKTLVYDAWVDHNNYVRQVGVAIPLSTATLNYAIRYTLIDPAVTLAVPTAEQIFDVGQLLGGG